MAKEVVTYQKNGEVMSLRVERDQPRAWIEPEEINPKELEAAGEAAAEAELELEKVYAAEIAEVESAVVTPEVSEEPLEPLAPAEVVAPEAVVTEVVTPTEDDDQGSEISDAKKQTSRQRVNKPSKK